MLRELKTSLLTPRNYYELYMKVLDELRYVEDFFLALNKAGSPMVELYERVQVRRTGGAKAPGGASGCRLVIVLYSILIYATTDTIRPSLCSSCPSFPCQIDAHLCFQHLMHQNLLLHLFLLSF